MPPWRFFASAKCAVLPSAILDGMQFSLRALFALTTVAALTLWLVTSHPMVAVLIVPGALFSVLVVVPWVGLALIANGYCRLLRAKRRWRQGARLLMRMPRRHSTTSTWT